MSRTLAHDPQRATDWAGEFERLALERHREPAWLAELRREALRAFTRRGFPAPREEAWRYTNVAPIAQTRFVPNPGALETSPPHDLLARHGLGRDAAIELVFVDGRCVAGSAARAGDGVLVGSLANFLATEPHLIAPHLGRLASLDHPFAALNTAFFEDGVFVLVPRELALARPIHALHLITPRAEALAVHPRSLIVLEEGARATFVESFLGPDDAACLTTALTEIYVGPGASLERCERQEQGAATFHVALTRVRLERGASLRSHQLAFGAALSRTELDVELAGEGASSDLAGLYVLDGEQRGECRTFVDHAQPSGTSRQDFRGIVGGRARGAFAGEVLVRAGAQKSDAKQHNRNLLLSPDARADSKPELRIHADDVKCAHGATIGQLDESHVFYLRARGIGEPDARRMLTRAFASAVLGRIEPAALRASVERSLDARRMDGQP